jgi:hypothetical protein
MGWNKAENDNICHWGQKMLILAGGKVPKFQKVVTLAGGRAVAFKLATGVRASVAWFIGVLDKPLFLLPAQKGTASLTARCSLWPQAR